MEEIRRNRRWIESIDPVTSQKIYTDEVTGEVMVPNASGLPPGGYEPTAQVTERTVTQQAVPTNGQVVTQRTVTGPTTPSYHAQETAVVTEDPYEPRRVRNFKLQQAIYLIFGIIEGLLAIRFVLRLLGANPNAGFASAINAVTRPFMAPFANLFGTPAAGGNVVELNAIVAIIVYALIAWVLVKLARLAGGENRSAVRTSEVHRRIDK